MQLYKKFLALGLVAIFGLTAVGFVTAEHQKAESLTAGPTSYLGP